MSAMASQITGVSMVCSFVKAQIQEDIKISHHQPLWGEFIGPIMRKLNSISRCHHEAYVSCMDTVNKIIYAALDISVSVQVVTVTEI